MWKNVVRALHGYALWETVKIKYRIKYPKADWREMRFFFDSDMHMRTGPNGETV